MALAAGVALLHSQDLPSLLVRFQAEPRNAQLCEQIGVAYTRREEFDKAAEFYRKAFEMDPRRVSAGKNLGTVLWYGGHKKEAVAIFSVIEKRIPKDPVPALYLGLAGFERQDFHHAAEFFERAGTLASQNPEVIPILLETDLAAGKFEQAKSLVEARIAAPDASSPEEVSRNYRWLGQACDGLKLADQAFHAYQQAVEHGPDMEENYLALSAFAMEHANASFARKTLSEGLARHPDSAHLTMQLGLTWAEEGDFTKARPYFEAAAAADAHSSLPLLALGIAELQEGSAAAAGEAFAKARDLAPGDYRGYYLHATAVGRGNPDPAERKAMIAELRRAIERNPGQARVRVALAQAELSSDPRAAEAQLREALRLEPAAPEALYQLALLMRREGKTTEAERLSQAFQAAKSKLRENENELVLILKTPK
jgi:tetratricopeptide (TPR) repeat protein